MQIQKVETGNSTNFKRIKSIKCEGLYKNNPEYGKKLVDALRQNVYAMDFCKKYNVDIVFFARKTINSIESSIHIFYDNPTINKFKKFLKFLSSSEDKVSISGWGNQIQESSKELIDRILPETSNTSQTNNGLLSAHLENTDKLIQDVLNKRAEKKALRLKKAEEKANKADLLKSEEAKLSAMIEDMIESTK